MSLAELKREVAGLSPAEQAELVAYINDQLQPDDPAYRRELARLLDDQDRRNWVRWNDAKRETDIHSLGAGLKTPPWFNQALPTTRNESFT